MLRNTHMLHMNHTCWNIHEGEIWHNSLLGQKDDQTNMGSWHGEIEPSFPFYAQVQSGNELTLRSSICTLCLVGSVAKTISIILSIAGLWEMESTSVTPQLKGEIPQGVTEVVG